jgi:ATP-dependent Clp protease ATP-binding subunit ClpA
LERFSDTARGAVRQARDQAHGLHHDYIGTEHLLLALLTGDGGIATRVLQAHGVSQETVRAAIVDESGEDLDREALATLGIDLDVVRAAVEASLGPGALDAPASSAPGGGRQPFTRSINPARRPVGPWFTRPAKKSLELALREAVQHHRREIDSGDLLVGIIRAEGGLGARILEKLGQDLETLCAEAVAAPRTEAA